MDKLVIGKYIGIVAAVILAWYLSVHINPVLITLIGLLIMAGSTVWLIVSLIRKPGEARQHVKSWWKVFWDGFWGIG